MEGKRGEEKHKREKQRNRERERERKEKEGKEEEKGKRKKREREMMKRRASVPSDLVMAASPSASSPLLSATLTNTQVHGLSASSLDSAQTTGSTESSSSSKNGCSLRLSEESPIGVVLRIRPEEIDENEAFPTCCLDVMEGGKAVQIVAPTTFQATSRWKTPRGLRMKTPARSTSRRHSVSMSWRTPSQPHQKVFEFDQIYGPDATQEAIFSSIQPLVDAAMDGYNSTVIASGATGCGKTHSIMGNVGAPGVLPRCISYAFQKIREKSNAEGSSEATTEMSLSYVELYRGKFRDLLEPLSQGPGARYSRIDIRESRQRGVFLSGSKTLRTPIANVESALRLIKRGNRLRSTSSTDVNEQSSRSHCIATIHVVKRFASSKKERHSKMHIIDLAGNERVDTSGVSGTALLEAQAINLSLTALSNVLMALSTPNSELWLVPYRNSKLTHLLKDSLGGNARTLFIGHVRQESRWYRQTLLTLDYASRAKRIKNLVSRVSVQDNDGATDTALVANLRARNKRLEDAVSVAQKRLSEQSTMLQEKIRQIEVLQLHAKEREAELERMRCAEAASKAESDAMQRRLEHLDSIIDRDRNSGQAAQERYEREREELTSRLEIAEEQSEERKSLLEAIQKDYSFTKRELERRVEELCYSNQVAEEKAAMKNLTSYRRHLP